MPSRRPIWPLGTRWRWLVFPAVVLVLAAAWALFFPAADWLARHDVGAGTHGALLLAARDDARGRLLTLSAGLLATSALVFTARNFTLSRHTFELTQQGQVTDRYTKAIEQLGSDKLDVRIGGIYALERVARDSVRDHPTVMEVLTAFIREHSRETWPEPDPGAQEQEQSIRPDVQAAVTVVGRRDPVRDVQRIDLSRAVLTSAVLTGANLADANLTYANLTYADLSGAVLSGAVLSGADLTYADLTRADLTRANLSRADLTRAVLSRANLTGAVLSGADLADADLTYADLTGACLTLTKLTRTNLSAAVLSGMDLFAADLTPANLAGANWPEDRAVPGGWERDPSSGRLSREN